MNGEVWFAPDTNFHGTASFTYTVTDQYGLSTNGIATLLIAAVNDVPVTQGESYSSDEDIGLIFTQAQLLANDSDVDVATDAQALSISRVSGASHGQVTLQSNGGIRFVPDVNYHGPAEFTYWVSDGSVNEGAGAEVATAILKTELRLGTCSSNSKMDTKFRSMPAAKPSFSWDKPCSRRSSRTTSPKACAKVRVGGFAVNRRALVMPTIVRNFT